jgi:hypothetical protein
MGFDMEAAELETVLLFIRTTAVSNNNTNVLQPHAPQKQWFEDSANPSHAVALFVFGVSHPTYKTIEFKLVIFDCSDL